jgi:hypothetical protein
MSKPTTFKELISTWPTVEGLSPNQTFAKDLRVSTLHVNTMKQRNQVATTHWERLLLAAQRRKVKLNYEDLLEMREAGQSPHRTPTLLPKKPTRTLKLHA